MERRPSKIAKAIEKYRFLFQVLSIRGSEKEAGVGVGVSEL
jgi:hypothetical protein